MTPRIVAPSGRLMGRKGRGVSKKPFTPLPPPIDPPAGAADGDSPCYKRDAHPRVIGNSDRAPGECLAAHMLTFQHYTRATSFPEQISCSSQAEDGLRKPLASPSLRLDTRPNR